MWVCAGATVPADQPRQKDPANKLGQYYCWNRTYDVNLGRWTTPDPVATPWWNLFDYCDIDVTTQSDSSGLSGGVLIKDGKHIIGVPLTRDDIPKGARWVDVHDPHQEVYVTSKARVKFFLFLGLLTFLTGNEYASPLFVKRPSGTDAGEEAEGPIGPIIGGDKDSVGGRFAIPPGCDVRGTVHTHPRYGKERRPPGPSIEDIVDLISRVKEGQREGFVVAGPCLYLVQLDGATDKDIGKIKGAYSNAFQQCMDSGPRDHNAVVRCTDKAIRAVAIGYGIRVYVSCSNWRRLARIVD